MQVMASWFNSMPIRGGKERERERERERESWRETLYVVYVVVEGVFVSACSCSSQSSALGLDGRALGLH